MREKTRAPRPCRSIQLSIYPSLFTLICFGNQYPLAYYTQPLLYGPNLNWNKGEGGCRGVDLNKRVLGQGREMGCVVSLGSAPGELYVGEITFFLSIYYNILFFSTQISCRGAGLG